MGVVWVSHSQKETGWARTDTEKSWSVEELSAARSGRVVERQAEKEGVKVGATWRDVEGAGAAGSAEERWEC